MRRVLLFEVRMVQLLRNALIFSLLNSMIVTAQYTCKELIVVDRDTVPIENATIYLDEIEYTATDARGIFVLHRFDFSVLAITHISYDTLLVAKESLKKSPYIFLDQSSNTLDEVIVTTKNKVKDSEKKIITLQPERALMNFLFENKEIRMIFNRAIYVPNTQSGTYVIKKIIHNSRGNRAQNGEKESVVALNLFTYDSISKKPSEQIFPEDIEVFKKNGQHYFEVELPKNRVVVFPKSGICIVVKLYSKAYYKQHQMPIPTFSAVQIANQSLFREYNEIADDWKELGYSIIREQCFDFGIVIEKVN